MNEEFNIRQQLCPCGKVCFDKRGAQTKKNMLEKTGRQKHIRIYQCDRSPHWHITKAYNYKEVADYRANGNYKILR